MTQSSATYTGAVQKPYHCLPLEGDHRSIVKFKTPVDKQYESVKGKIREFVNKAVEDRRSTGISPRHTQSGLLKS